MHTPSWCNCYMCVSLECSHRRAAANWLYSAHGCLHSALHRAKSSLLPPGATCTTLLCTPACGPSLSQFMQLVNEADPNAIAATQVLLRFPHLLPLLHHSMQQVVWGSHVDVHQAPHAQRGQGGKAVAGWLLCQCMKLQLQLPATVHPLGPPQWLLITPSRIGQNKWKAAGAGALWAPAQIIAHPCCSNTNEPIYPIFDLDKVRLGWFCYICIAAESGCFTNSLLHFVLESLDTSTIVMSVQIQNKEFSKSGFVVFLNDTSDVIFF